MTNITLSSARFPFLAVGRKISDSTRFEDLHIFLCLGSQRAGSTFIVQTGL